MKNLLVTGPPGTGQVDLARAFAMIKGVKFIDISQTNIWKMRNEPVWMEDKKLEHSEACRLASADALQATMGSDTPCVVVGPQLLYYPELCTHGIICVLMASATKLVDAYVKKYPISKNEATMSRFRLMLAEMDRLIVKLPKDINIFRGRLGERTSLLEQGWERLMEVQNGQIPQGV